MGWLVSNSPQGPGAGRSARLITRLVASPCIGAQSRPQNHGRAPAPRSRPTLYLCCAHTPRAGIGGPQSLPRWEKLLPVAGLWTGVFFMLWFLSSQDYFSLCVKTKGENTCGRWGKVWRTSALIGSPNLFFLLFHEENVLGRAGPSEKLAVHQHPAASPWPAAPIGQLDTERLVRGRPVPNGQEPNRACAPCTYR